MINSNGIREHNIFHIAPEKLHYISFSLDGATAQTHDTVRGEGTYAKTMECIRHSVAARYHVRLICTISQINIHEAEAMLKMADELGVQMVNFHVVSEEGLGAGQEELSLTPQEWVAFYENLETIRHRYRTSIWYPPTYATLERLEKVYMPEGFRGCVGCSLDRISIFPDGRVYVCSVLFDKPLHFGIMGEKGLEINRGNNEFELFTAAMYRASKPWLSGCPAEEILARQGKKSKPDHLISMCRLWKSQTTI
jgi:MoaA/NifB/PqqE/SkfB family radical SAM enzyme